MHILIADDESIIRMGLKSMLAGMGHSITAASNGRDALKRFDGEKVELAILDINMPHVDGLHVAKAIAKARPIPIIILTAYSQAELIERAAEIAIHGYLVKPVTPENLAGAIQVAVKRFEELASMQRERDKLKRQLEGRKIVDRAKGKLMAEGIGEEEAYGRLRRMARDTGRSIEFVAAQLLRENP